MSDVPSGHPLRTVDCHLPSKRRVGMFALIAGRARFSPYLPLPMSSIRVSFTIWRAEQAVENDQMASFTAWLGATIALAALFLASTAVECQKLIYQDGLTISKDLFGTTFYSLVGLHATHVVVGLFLLTSAFVFSVFGWVDSRQGERFGVVALYWHFVDAIWIVVFSVVYLMGR